MKNNKEPTVIHVTNVYFPFIGGISNYIKNLCLGLRERGIECSVLTYPYRFWQLELRIANLKLRKFVHRALVIPFILYSLARILGTRLSAEVVLHTHSAAFCMLIGVLAKILFGCRCVHTFHSPIDEYSTIIRRYARNCDHVVFVSQAARELYEKIERMSFADAAIRPGSVDPAVYSPPEAEELKTLVEKYRSRYNITVNSKLLLFVGRVTAQKGVADLVSMMPDISRAVPTVFLLIAGPYDATDEQKAEYKRALEIMRKKAIGNVIFTGALSHDEILELYKLCDIVVCPSHWPELSPMVVVEAMACGKPVIGTDTGGLIERISDGKTGFTVPENRFDMLPEKIILSLSDERLRSELGKNARALAMEKYAIAKCAEMYMKLYEE